MRKYIMTIAAIAALVLAASCSKENMDSENPKDEASQDLPRSQKLVQMTFEMDSQTKTAIDSEGKVSWSEGDQVKVIWGAAAGDYTVATVDVESDGTASITAEVGEDGPYFAVYPSTVETTFTPATDSTSARLALVVPAIQSGKFEDAAISSSYTTKDEKNFGIFRSCVSLLRFDIQRENVTKVDFSSVLTKVVGSVNVVPSADSLSIAIGTKSNEVVSMAVNGAGTYYMAMAPDCTLSALAFRFSAGTDCIGTVYKALPSSMTLRRATVLPVSKAVDSKIHPAGDWYIKKTASGTGDGSSWENAAGESALHLLLRGTENVKNNQAYMKWAIDNATINVAAGTYAGWASEGGRNSIYADSVDGIKFTIRGGFSESGAYDPSVNKVIFSGDNDGDGTADAGVFKLNEGTDVTVKGICFSKVNVTSGNGGAICSTGILQVEDCTFENCTATGKCGGAIGSDAAAGESGYVLTATNCTFSNCSATDGGAIRVYNNTGCVEGCVFSNNTAERGGAILIGSGGCIDVVSCSFSGNSATNATVTTTQARKGGGAICNTGSGTMTISGTAAKPCTFSGNSSLAYGGALITNTGLISVTGATFSGNTAAAGGAAIYCTDGELQATGCTFTNNKSTAASNNLGGGAIGTCYNSKNTTITSGMSKPITIVDCEASGNQGKRGGFLHTGGSGTTTLTGCNIYNNVSTGNGGGALMLLGNGPLYVNGCNFTGNKTSLTNSNGAGSVLMSKSDGYFLFNNCLFANNVASGSYAAENGGLFQLGGSETFLGFSNCTFFNNASKNKLACIGFRARPGALVNCSILEPASAAGVIFTTGSSIVKLFNSIVLTSDGGDYSVVGSVALDGHNILGTVSGTTISGTDLSGATSSDVFQSGTLVDGKLPVNASISGFTAGSGSAIKTAVSSFNSTFATWLTSINAFADRGEGQWNPGA